MKIIDFLIIIKERMLLFLSQIYLLNPWCYQEWLMKIYQEWSIKFVLNHLHQDVLGFLIVHPLKFKLKLLSEGTTG